MSRQLLRTAIVFDIRIYDCNMSIHFKVKGINSYCLTQSSWYIFNNCSYVTWVHKQVINASVLFIRDVRLPYKRTDIVQTALMWTNKLLWTYQKHFKMSDKQTAICGQTCSVRCQRAWGDVIFCLRCIVLHPYIPQRPTLPPSAALLQHWPLQSFKLC